MAVDDVYRIKCKDGFREIPTIRDAIHDALVPMLASGDGIECVILAHAVMKVLVPDDTKQALADAWNYDDVGQGRYEVRQQWPELADLLDALIKEER